MHIPFLDLKATHDPLRPELLRAIERVMDASAFSGGPFVEQFEREFAAYCETAHALGVANGTDALWLALLALGVGAGDEVITVPNSFIATAEAISYCGATPVFVDVDERTYTMDPARLEAAITSRTKAIIPVHLFGQMADMDPILEIARRRGVPVVEDACQAHGADYRGRKAGTLGVVGCFSFYPGKNLGAMGEAGGIVTADTALRDKMKVLRDHGQIRKYHHTTIGWNARMDGIQAAVLSVKLKHLDFYNERRRKLAARYEAALAGTPGLTTPVAAPGRGHIYHVYAVRVPGRDSVLASMAGRGVQCGIHYPVPIHLQVAYSALGLGVGSFPVAERCAGDFLSLPIFPELAPEQADTVAHELRTVLNGHAKS